MATSALCPGAPFLPSFPVGRVGRLTSTQSRESPGTSDLARTHPRVPTQTHMLPGGEIGAHPSVDAFRVCFLPFLLSPLPPFLPLPFLLPAQHSRVANSGIHTPVRHKSHARLLTLSHREVGDSHASPEQGTRTLPHTRASRPPGSARKSGTSHMHAS